MSKQSKRPTINKSFKFIMKQNCGCQIAICQMPNAECLHTQSNKKNICIEIINQIEHCKTKLANFKQQIERTQFLHLGGRNRFAYTSIYTSMPQSNKPISNSKMHAFKKDRWIETSKLICSVFVNKIENILLVLVLLSVLLLLLLLCCC